MEAKMVTDQGKIRETNEDAVGIFYHSNQQHLLAIVADGMGGHQAGEVASSLAVAFVKEKWKNAENIASETDAEQWLQSCITELNSYILEKSNANEHYQGMGTTVVMALCTHTFVTIAHVGDSRCYYLANKQLDLKTRDHSYVYELVKNGEITLEEADSHPKKNVLLRVIGTEEIVKADIASFNWEQSHRLLLCSDGLTNKVSKSEIEKLVKKNTKIDQKLQKLINLANDRGGEDNISIIIIQNEQKKEGDKT